jgi:hypothetical protein
MANANVVTWAGRSIYNNYIKGNANTTAPVNIGWGTGGTVTVTNSAFSDVNLFGAVSTVANSEARASGTVNILTANNLGDTLQVAGTITAAAPRAITEVGLFDVGGANTNLSPQGTIATLTAVATTGAIGGNTKAFPAASNNYYAQIENEVVLVTGGQGTTTLTFTRGALGSVAATHAAGSVITAGGDGLTYQSNASASLATWNPTAANGGSMFVHADFPVINLLTNDSIAFTLKVQLS